MKWTKVFFLFFITITMSSEMVMANCGYSLDTPTLSYRVSDYNSTSQSTVSITRNKDNGNPCSLFFLAFTKGGAGSYNRRATNLSNGNTIYYNIYKNSNSTGILKESSDISSPDETFFGTINKDQTNYYTYYMTLAPFGSIPPAAGTYVDNIQVQAYAGTYTKINSVEGHRDMNIYIVVSKFTSISLVDSGGTYDPAQTSKTLDFGELTTGEELGFDVRVASNAGYRLKISSSNNGHLKLIGASGSKSQIDYSFYSNGTQVGLGNSSSSPVTIASGSGVTPAQGVKVPIRVVIGTVDNTKVPGTYQDYITLTTISTD
ncbi:MAG: spore coat protein U domain-containing protein [Bacteriovorax sp.]|nr:spore coat protein U domain-containing protein [Bacteriovorax sp.]